MRKAALTALAALTMSLMGSAAALADSGFGGSPDGQFRVDPAPNGPRGNWNGQPNIPLPPPPVGPQGGYGQGGYGGERGQTGGYHDEWSRNGFDDHGFGGERGDHGDRGYGRRYDRNDRFFLQFDFGRFGGNFDRWERGWNHDGYDSWNHRRPLNSWQLARALEVQGYYGVRDLRPARWGFGYRAFAFNYRGMPVMIRINPYNGRVIDVRYLQNYGYGYGGGRY